MPGNQAAPLQQTKQNPRFSSGLSALSHIGLFCAVALSLAPLQQCGKYCMAGPYSRTVTTRRQERWLGVVCTGSTRMLCCMSICRFPPFLEQPWWRLKINKTCITNITTMFSTCQVYKNSINCGGIPRQKWTLLGLQYAIQDMQTAENTSCFPKIQYADAA